MCSVTSNIKNAISCQDLILKYALFPEMRCEHFLQPEIIKFVKPLLYSAKGSFVAQLHEILILTLRLTGTLPSVSDACSHKVILVPTQGAVLIILYLNSVGSKMN